MSLFICRYPTTQWKFTPVPVLMRAHGNLIFQLSANDKLSKETKKKHWRAHASSKDITLYHKRDGINSNLPTPVRVRPWQLFCVLLSVEILTTNYSISFLNDKYHIALDKMYHDTSFSLFVIGEVSKRWKREGSNISPFEIKYYMLQIRNALAFKCIYVQI